MNHQWEKDHQEMLEDAFYGKWSQAFRHAPQSDIQDEMKWPTRLLECLEYPPQESVQEDIRLSRKELSLRIRREIDRRSGVGVGKVAEKRWRLGFVVAVIAAICAVLGLLQKCRRIAEPAAKIGTEKQTSGPTSNYAPTHAKE